jgi:hypothetical protein
MMALSKDESTPRASPLRLAVMGFLTVWCPYVFVWFIQKPEYPTVFRRCLTAWAILWCCCAAVFLIVRPY